MGHCVGGLSLFMAIGGGMEGLRSATFSSLAGHPIPTPGNQARAHARLATLFKLLGVKRLNIDYDPKRLDGKAIESLMKTLPFRHVYDNPVARRIYFVYGDVYDYENINQPTMSEAVPAFFGNGNMTFFEHISLMIRAERGARRRTARTPTGRTWTTSSSRSTSSPASTTRCSCRRACSARMTRFAEPTDRRTTRTHVIKDYAHLDLWLGTNAERDVWPTALAELEKHN